MPTKLVLFIICAIAFFFRTFSILWDHGFSLHPDERAIVMFTQNLSLPNSISQFFSVNSPLNPNFFAYGTLPLYLLKLVSEVVSALNPQWQTFANHLVLGRLMSSAADLGTLIFIFLIGKQLHSKNVGLLSSAVYAVSVFPIQTSHFYAVDILLTFFMTATLYFAIRFFHNNALKYLIFSAIFFGFAVSTKISAFPVILPVGLLILIRSFSDFKLSDYSNVLNRVLYFAWNMIVFILATLITTFICQPYAFIDLRSFLNDTTAQSAMTKSAFTFPYTLQYVNKLPYLHELENIFLWGLGPVLSILTLIGIGIVAKYVFLFQNYHKKILYLSILIYVFVYFGIVGSFAVGWMRYMLPLYPLFAFLSAMALFTWGGKILNSLRYLSLRIIFIFIITTLTTAWTFTFLHIYAEPHPRVSASKWIHNNIPAGSTLGVEHWDDHLPLYNGDRYIHIEYPLYDPDTPEKWQTMEDKINNTDYIILASNRLYEPLQELVNCEELPEGRCYRQTAAYYQLLFSEQFGFEKVAEFTNYPTVPFLNIEINDQSADESFTVYDHPKVIIFKKK